MKSTTTADSPAQPVRFPRFEFLAIFLPVAAVILVAGFSFASLHTQTKLEELINADSKRLHLLSGFLGGEVTGSLHHLQAMASEPEVRRVVEDGGRRARQDLEAMFKVFAQRNPQYVQVRWIDVSGMERVRVGRDTAGMYVVAEKDLQDKRDRYYVAATRQLLRGEYYVSRADLNVENGRVEEPPRPVLRIATALFDTDKRRRGALVLNLSLQGLLASVQPDAAAREPLDVLLLNQSGEVLSGASLEDHAEPIHFDEQHALLWQRIGSRLTGHLEAEDGLWTWRRVSPLASFEQADVPAVLGAPIDRIIENGFTVIMAVHRPVAALLDLRREGRMFGSLAAVLAIALYGLAVYLYLNGQVRAQQAKLNAAFALARAEAAEKTRQLEERFHRLVEASSIGQMVVDSDGKVTISNHAMETILGYSKQELAGIDVESLLPTELRELHAALRSDYLQAPEARLMGGGRVLHARRKDGSQVEVEIGLNPYSEDGQVRVLVQVISSST